MKVTIRSPFPTVEDTARILGVSDKRLKELLRLTRSTDDVVGPKRESALLEKSRNKSARLKSKASTRNRHSVTRKRRARGKSAKAVA